MKGGVCKHTEKEGMFYICLLISTTSRMTHIGWPYYCLMIYFNCDWTTIKVLLRPCGAYFIHKTLEGGLTERVQRG